MSCILVVQVGTKNFFLTLRQTALVKLFLNPIILIIRVIVGVKKLL